MSFDFEAWCRRIEAALPNLQIPGAAVGVVQGSQDWTAGIGVTGIENPLPVNADTLFQVGSITKTVTATAAMRLVEARKLDLDTPIRTYLLHLRMASDEVTRNLTLRHLFTHTGGFTGDFFLDTGDGDDAMEKIVACMPELRQWTPLGEVWFYNNAGFYLASRVLEVVMEKPFETALKEAVLRPLEMEHSYFFAKDVLLHRFAVGHEATTSGPRVAHPFRPNRAANATGGLVMSLHDLLRYARFHLGDGRAPDGTRLLSPESLADLHTPLLPAGWPFGESVGLSWYVLHHGKLRLVRHPGLTNGQNALLTLVPQNNLAIAVLTNGNRGIELVHAASGWALNELLGGSQTDTDTAFAPPDFESYVGEYEGPECRLQCELSRKDLVLRIDLHADADVAEPLPPRPFKMVWRDPATFRLPEAPFEFQGGEFVRGPLGRFAWCRVGGHIATRTTT